VLYLGEATEVQASLLRARQTRSPTASTPLPGRRNPRIHCVLRIISISWSINGGRPGDEHPGKLRGEQVLGFPEQKTRNRASAVRTILRGSVHHDCRRHCGGQLDD